MGIIETWKSRSPRNDRVENTVSAFLESGCHDDLLKRVSRFQSQNRFAPAMRLMRAGVIRFQPWPEGEEKLALLEKQHARLKLAAAQEKADSEFSALHASRLADLLDILGDRAGWQLWSRAAIEEDPCDPEGYLAVARSHLRRFRRDADGVAGLGALRYLTKACQLRPGHGECLRDLASLLLSLRAPKAAKKVLAPLQRAAAGDPVVMALSLLAEELPEENTANVQELFLRWETGVEPVHSPAEYSVLPSTRGIDLWELSQDRSLVAHSEAADTETKTIEHFSVLSGTLHQAMPRMGMGEFVRFTSRGKGGVLMGQAEEGSTLLGHCSRASHEGQLSRLLQQTCEDEVRR
ncbi:MAG: tetratricopeptide repeat protein [Planctomycetota bacterium]